MAEDGRCNLVRTDNVPLAMWLKLRTSLLTVADAPGSGTKDLGVCTAVVRDRCHSFLSISISNCYQGNGRGAVKSLGLLTNICSW